MKRAAFIAVIISILMIACKTQQQAVSVNNDDVYSTPARHKSQPAKSPDFNQDLTSALASDQAKVAPDSLTKAATLDYSDVSYAARLQKFQHPQSTKSYFDNTTSDTTVIYSNSPNVSINFGYGGGYYDPYFSMGFGWGYPSYGWGFGWDYSYYWGYPYWGYNPYCYCCYYPYYGEGNGYYNSYYGPRESAVSNTAYSRNSRGEVSNPASSARNERGTVVTANNRSLPPSSVRSTTSPLPSTRGADPVYTRTGTQPSPGVRSADPVTTTQRKPPASQERYHYTRPSNERQGTYSRNTGNNNAYRETKQQPAPRYTQPGATPVQRQGQVQNYTPGSYRQARSSQEYINPRVQSQNSAVRQGSTSGNRGGSSVDQRGYVSPSGTRSSAPGSGARQYSSPRNYSPGSSSPSRGYSPGYSSPSHSAPSYSAPSGGGRSGGGSYGGGGGGRSGGGGGGGGGSPRK
ncbi:MAG: hypothetical protein NTW31_04715 [Bacteroidetes bacterium]|nr:hypothetical protein [Bacteroidota bacterium]